MMTEIDQVRRTCVRCSKIRLLHRFPLVDPSDMESGARSAMCEFCDPTARAANAEMTDRKTAETDEVYMADVKGRARRGRKCLIIR